MNAMIKFGWLSTTYIALSFALFLSTSFAMGAWIVYLFLVLPFYIVILLTTWLFVLVNREKTPQIRYSFWGLALFLQTLVILTAPGNCYGINQGDICYSNLQILLGNAPRTGPVNLPHWTLVEHSFWGFLIAYSAVVIIGLIRIIRRTKVKHLQEEQ